jgi:hypothetical protein
MPAFPASSFPTLLWLLRKKFFAHRNDCYREREHPCLLVARSPSGSIAITDLAAGRDARAPGRTRTGISRFC